MLIPARLPFLRYILLFGLIAAFYWISTSGSQHAQLPLASVDFDLDSADLDLDSILPPSIRDKPASPAGSRQNVLLKADLLDSDHDNEPTSPEPIATPKPKAPSPKVASQGSGDDPIETTRNSQEFIHFTRIVDESRAKHLMIVLTQNNESWGHINEEARTFHHYAAQLSRSGLSLEEMSIAIETSSTKAYQQLIHDTSGYPFAKVQILYREEYHLRGQPELRPDDRHDPTYQRVRRQRLAVARNELMARTLGPEDHIFWVDADVARIDRDMFAVMLRHASAPWPNAAVRVVGDSFAKADGALPPGVITARCVEAHNEVTWVDYDQNAWAHGAAEPGHVVPADDRRGKTDALPRRSKVVQGLERLTGQSADADLVWLDSVGGTVLFLRADLVRMGLTFPPYLVVGTTWKNRNGYDGLETEGVCFVANTLGYGCYALGGSWHSNHCGSLPLELDD